MKALYAQITLLLLGLGLAFAFDAVPEGFSPALAVFVLSVFAVLLVQALSRPVTLLPGHPSQFHGAVLFLVFNFVLLFYPYLLVLLGDLDLRVQSKFTHNYNDMSNKAMVASLLLVVGFSLGTMGRFRPRSPVRALARDVPRLFPRILVGLECMAIGSFFALGGGAWLNANYSRQTQMEEGSLNQIFLVATLLTMIVFASGLFSLHRRKLQPMTVLGMVAGGVWMLALLMVGDRNSLFLILTVIFAGIGVFFLRVRLVTLALMTFLALTLYSGFEKARRIEGRTLGAVFAAILSPENSESLAQSSLADTTAVVRAGFGYVPAVADHANGRLFALSVAGIVPKLRAAVFGADPGANSSSLLLTQALIGPYANYGVGTALVSDLYIDLGIWFVLVGAIVVGRFWGWIRHRAEQCPEDHDAVVLFLVAVAICAELPRYGFGFAVRPVVWTMLLLWLTRWLSEFFAPHKRGR